MRNTFDRDQAEGVRMAKWPRWLLIGVSAIGWLALLLVLSAATALVAPRGEQSLSAGLLLMGSTDLVLALAAFAFVATFIRLGASPVVWTGVPLGELPPAIFFLAVLVRGAASDPGSWLINLGQPALAIVLPVAAAFLASRVVHGHGQVRAV